MLEKLKVECGVNTMNKISKMFSDMQLSKDLKAEFEQKRGPVIAGIAFSAEILTNGTWPSENVPKCEIPTAMKQCTDQFKMFYS